MNTQEQREEGNDKGVIATVLYKTGSIPLDLTIEILTRLPVKSLFRFRCVSKQWCSTIRNKSFIDSFMSISLSRPRFALGYNIHHDNENQLLYFSWPLHLQESNHSSSVVSKNDTYESRISPPSYKIRICNSVRGIILIRLNERYFVICNPTTRQVLKIPNDISGSDPEYDTCYMFWGYNPSNDEYKVLRKMMKQDGILEHSVCTLLMGQQSCFSPWRFVENNVFYYCRGGNMVCINGVLYYGAGIKSSERFMVMCFDVGSERLLLMQGPNEEQYNLIINYQGKLACFGFNSNKNCYSLWVLDDVEKQIWSTVDFSPSFNDLYLNLKPTTCGTNGGEVVFASALKDDEFEIFYYDLKKKNVRRRVKVGGVAHKEEFRAARSNISRCISISCDHVDNIVYF